MTRVWLVGLLRRRGTRLVAAAAGVAVAVALLASLGAFLAGSKASMTQRAAAAVAVDWQVQVQPGADPAAVLDTVRTAPGTTTALPVELARTVGLSATTTTGITAASTQTTGPGVVLGLPANYQAVFPGTVRALAGAPTRVLLAQQTAANLHAAPGDTVLIGHPGLTPVPIRIDGIVALPQADSLFQQVGAPAGAQPAAPPDNVLLLPQALWHTVFDPVAATRPDQATTQIHTARSHALPADPAAAYTTATAAAHNLEVRAGGAAVVGDNLGATLGTAREDAAYAQVLFLFLGAPGAVLAGRLTAAITATGAARRRQEQALLRSRGAEPRALLGLAGVEAAAVGVTGSVVGLGAAAMIGRVTFGSAAFGATAATAVGWGAGRRRGRPGHRRRDPAGARVA